MTVGLVEETYVDAFGERRTVPPDVRAAVAEAMGGDDAETAGAPPTAVVRPGGRLPQPGTVTLEDGSDLGRLGRLPRDVPFGYHRLTPDDAGRDVLLIVGPGRCHLPERLREWGWAVQLYALRSSASWGIGDLSDLRGLADWSVARRAGFLAVSPIGAPNPGPVPEASPYYPSTRRFWNPLHLAVEEVPGVGDTDVLGDLARAGRALNDDRRIDRGRVLALKREALERIWAAGIGRERRPFATWRASQGEPLRRWATYCLLSERYGAGWAAWPEDYRDPASAAVQRAAEEEPDRVGFHAWVQWCLDRQLAAASHPLRWVADMPVGVDPGGFDAWDWQRQVALDASVGAPPDRFNAAGQDWGLPPFIPGRLREAGYGPFIETIRAQLRHAGGLRIDHVLGLFRLWCIPRGDPPDRGAYVRYPTDDMLEIVAIESHRAGAVIIGEDLGTVPPGVRRELRRRRVLSTRLAYFEQVAPSRYPRSAFAAVTTHDLPTAAGVLSGVDLEDQRRSGVDADPEGAEHLRRQLWRAAGVGRDAALGDLLVAVHRRLAASPSVLVAGTLEDALGVEERPNLPGTVSDQRPNWALALPVPLEKLVRDPRVRRVAEALASR